MVLEYPLNIKDLHSSGLLYGLEYNDEIIVNLIIIDAQQYYRIAKQMQFCGIMNGLHTPSLIYRHEVLSTVY